MNEMKWNKSHQMRSRIRSFFWLLVYIQHVRETLTRASSGSGDSFSRTLVLRPRTLPTQTLHYATLKPTSTLGPRWRETIEALSPWACEFCGPPPRHRAINGRDDGAWFFKVKTCERGTERQKCLCARTYCARPGEVSALGHALPHLAVEQASTHTLQVLWGKLSKNKKHSRPLEFKVPGVGKKALSSDAYYQWCLI